MAGRIEQEVLIRFRSDTKSLEKGSKKAQAAMKQTAGATKNLNQQTIGTVEQFQILGQLGGAMPGQLSPVAGAVSALSGAFKAAKGNMLAFGLVAGGVILGLIKFRGEIGELIGDLFSAGKEFERLENTLDSLREAQLKTIKTSEALTASLFPEEQEGKRRSEAIKNLRVTRNQRIALAITAKTEARAAATERFEDDPTVSVGERDRAFAAAEADYQQAKTEAIHAQQAGHRALEQQILASEQARADRATKIAAAEAAEAGGGGGGRGGGGGDPVDFSGSELRGRYARPPLPPVFGGRERGRFGGPIQRGGQFEDREQRGVGVSEGDFAKIFEEQERLQEALKASEMAASSFGQAMTTTSESVINAFEQWGEGAISLGDALKSAAGNALGDILMGEAQKHGALAAASFFSGNPVGGAGHLAAAAALSAASGAVRNFLGASGSSGDAGGGRLPGAAAGSFGGGGGGSHSQEIFVVEVPFSDSPRRRRKEISDAITRSRNQQRS